MNIAWQTKTVWALLGTDRKPGAAPPGFEQEQSLLLHLQWLAPLEPRHRLQYVLHQPCACSVFELLCCL